MFPVDNLHPLLGHSCADRMRETITSGRRLEPILDGTHLLAVWKNFIEAPNDVVSSTEWGHKRCLYQLKKGTFTCRNASQRA